MKTVTLLFIFAAILQLGSGKLKCYQCTSTSMSKKDPCYDPRSASHKELKPTSCSDDLGSQFIDLFKSIVSSDPLVPVCMKVDTRVGKDMITTRQCAMVPKNQVLTLEKCKSSTHLFSGGEISFCGVCEKDGCNTGSVLYLSVLTALLASIAYLFSIL